MTQPNPDPTSRESRLVKAFVTLADTLVDDYDTAEMLHQLVQYCVDILDATAAGLLLSDQRGGLKVLAASTERAQLLELFQVQADEGPCRDCFQTGRAVMTPDLSAQVQRWPRFARKAIETGFHSVHAIPLQLRGDTIGAMNLFGATPGELSAEDVQVARALADTATIAILHERALHRAEVVTEQLQTALNNRVIIEQAKGVIAQAVDLDMGEAFDLIRDYGRNHSTRLSSVAHQIVTGELDPGVLAVRRTVD